MLLEDFLWDLIGIMVNENLSSVDIDNYSIYVFMVGYGWVKYGIYSGQTSLGKKNKDPSWVSSKLQSFPKPRNFQVRLSRFLA